jgi:hypothetical protein
MLARGEPGVCRFCRCRGDTCRLANGDLCAWLTATKDTCNAVPCIRELERRQKETHIELERSRLERCRDRALRSRGGKSRKRGGKKRGT